MTRSDQLGRRAGDGVQCPLTTSAAHGREPFGDNSSEAQTSHACHTHTHSCLQQRPRKGGGTRWPGRWTLPRGAAALSRCVRLDHRTKTRAVSYTDGPGSLKHTHRPPLKPQARRKTGSGTARAGTAERYSAAREIPTFSRMRPCYSRPSLATARASAVRSKASWQRSVLTCQLPSSTRSTKGGCKMSSAKRVNVPTPW